MFVLGLTGSRLLVRGQSVQNQDPGQYCFFQMGRGGSSKLILVLLYFLASQGSWSTE